MPPEGAGEGLVRGNLAGMPRTTLGPEGDAAVAEVAGYLDRGEEPPRTALRTAGRHLLLLLAASAPGRLGGGVGPGGRGRGVGGGAPPHAGHAAERDRDGSADLVPPRDRPARLGRSGQIRLRRGERRPRRPLGVLGRSR